jgi:hypothetical protein
MEYGATTWNPYLKGDIEKLERIQNRAIRFVKKDYKSRETGAITRMREDLELRGGLLCSHSFGGKSYYIAILPGGIPLYSHFSGGKSYYIVIFPWGKTGYGIPNIDLKLHF